MERRNSIRVVHLNRDLQYSQAAVWAGLVGALESVESLCAFVLVDTRAERKATAKRLGFTPVTFGLAERLSA